jgi:hypothetical protein
LSSWITNPGSEPLKIISLTFHLIRIHDNLEKTNSKLILCLHEHQSC